VHRTLTLDPERFRVKPLLLSMQLTAEIRYSKTYASRSAGGLESQAWAERVLLFPPT